MNAHVGPFFHATLEDASHGRGYYRGMLLGTIYGDQKGRFFDGTSVHTSVVEADLGDGLFRTKSGTIYKVESWAPGHEPKINLALDVRNRLRDAIDFHAGEEDVPCVHNVDGNQPSFSVCDPKTGKRFRVTVEEII